MPDAWNPPLVDALARVRSRITQIRERGDAIGEQDTKASLIEPVLSALGWRLDDLDEVRREYRGKSKDNPADYALLVFGSPRLFVEAKALGVALDRKCAGQAIGYATMVGVNWCVLTNGDEYRLYNAHAAVDVDEKLFRSIRLSDEDQEAESLVTLSLLARERMQQDAVIDTLWKVQFVDRRIHSAVDRLFSQEDPGLLRLIRKEVPELSPADIRESLRRARVRIDFPAAPAAALARTTLSLHAPQPQSAPTRSEVASPRVSMADLIRSGVIVPPLTIEARYRGVQLTATVTADGLISYRGKTYATPSAAGSAARAEVAGQPDGPYPATNGWVFWQYRDPMSDAPSPLANLRLSGG